MLSVDNKNVQWWRLVLAGVIYFAILAIIVLAR